MMEDDTVVLNYYNITTPFPTAWPPEKDDSDPDEPLLGAGFGFQRPKSRYHVLEHNGGGRPSLVPGSEKLGGGLENLVQKDEADPLGSADSVIRVLRQRGAAVDEDQRLSEIAHHCIDSHC